MSAQRSWLAYPITYCRQEMETIAGWIAAGKSGSVIGPAGIGKSNLLGFLYHRPDALQLYLPAGTAPVVLIFVDLNDLPTYDPATFYRVMLRSFYEAHDRFPLPLATAVNTTYAENRTVTDPFVVQSALRQLLFLVREQATLVALIFDQFDHFCQRATPALTDTLRALRDTFKGTVSYIVGMRQEIHFLADPAILGELYEILDTDICRVQPLAADDARWLARRELDTAPATAEAIERLVETTGAYPSLLKAACHWWSKSEEQRPGEWGEAMLAQPAIVHRLEELWRGLSQEEQLALAGVQKGVLRPGNGRKQGARQPLAGPGTELNQPAYKRLQEKGLLQKHEEGWHIFSDLLAGYLATAAERGRGRIWLDPPSGNLYQGQTLLDNLSPLEQSLLRFLIDQPRTRHTYTAVIAAVWPADVVKQGVSTEALFQLVAGLRRKIEPDLTQPCYLVNWRGTPEGGYQCFPEGRPAREG